VNGVDEAFHLMHLCLAAAVNSSASLDKLLSSKLNFPKGREEARVSEPNGELSPANCPLALGVCSLCAMPNGDYNYRINSFCNKVPWRKVNEVSEEQRLPLEEGKLLPGPADAE
jgi:hypothetical protein